MPIRNSDNLTQGNDDPSDYNDKVIQYRTEVKFGWWVHGKYDHHHWVECKGSVEYDNKNPLSYDEFKNKLIDYLDDHVKLQWNTTRV